MPRGRYIPNQSDDQWNTQGSWIPDPQADYGTPPAPGYQPEFDKATGEQVGWINPSKEFGSFIPLGGTAADASQTVVAPDQHEGAAKWMRPVVLGSLAAMAGAGAAGAMGYGPAAGMGPNLLGGEGAASAAGGGLLGGAEALPVTAYGPAMTAPLNPATISATGIATGAAGLAGPYVLGNEALSSSLAQKAFDAANKSGGSTNTGGGSSTKTGGITDSVARLLKGEAGLEDILKLGGLLGGAYGLYKEADSKNENPTGYQPAIDGLQRIANAPQYNYQFQTQLSGKPQFGGGGMYQPQFNTQPPSGLIGYMPFGR